MQRIYQEILQEHLAHDKQMLFLTGPRQAGKTTLSRLIGEQFQSFYYFNWDVKEDKRLLMQGPLAIGGAIQLQQLRAENPLVVFDEIHKYRLWKTLLKGFYDTYQEKIRILVTGSAKLNVYRRGGDSLMGRYFLYRIHPLSVRECIRETPLKISETPYVAPKRITDDDFNALWEHGGFPDPFLRRTIKFSRRWQALREQQLFREEVRDLSQVHELAELEMVAECLKEYASRRVNLSQLAQKVDVSVNTIKHWLRLLETLYHCFTVRPWSKNIVRSLVKEPKIYLMDWSPITDFGAKAENFVACHLLKAVHFWQDSGLGQFDLFYIRDKDKNEVDFLITQNKQPWCLVEVKYSAQQGPSKQLYRFQEITRAPYAFQVVIDMDYVEADCFREKKPTIVPAKTFLSQLI